jgi:hypothetical protein
MIVVEAGVFFVDVFVRVATDEFVFICERSSKSKKSKPSLAILSGEMMMVPIINLRYAFINDSLVWFSILYLKFQLKKIKFRL